MISVSEALARILALATPLDAETVPLADAAGRVLAQDVTSNITQPPFTSSAMDGYAVIYSEAQTGMTLEVVGESAAGKRYDTTLNSGEAVRIFTGAPVPEGADSILIQEDADRIGDVITVRENRDTKKYVRPAGGDFAKGDVVSAPRRLTPANVALLASMNIANVPVMRKPVIALISTGNELVMPGEVPNSDQIISSNSFGLKALFEAQGASVRIMPIARDTSESLQQAFDLAKGADLVVTLGGASVGDHDLVQSVAIENGLELDFYKVAMRPGKPLMAGRINGAAMVGLPGNPVSSMVCGHIFLRPLIDAMLGLPATPLLRETGVLGEAMQANSNREHYMRAIAKPSANGWTVMPFDRQDSSLLSVLGDADCLMVREANDPARAIGEPISFIRI